MSTDNEDRETNWNRRRIIALDLLEAVCTHSGKGLRVRSISIVRVVVTLVPKTSFVNVSPKSFVLLRTQEVETCIVGRLFGEMFSIILDSIRRQYIR